LRVSVTEEVEVEMVEQEEQEVFARLASILPSEIKSIQILLRIHQEKTLCSLQKMGMQCCKD
jgi:hypothetical protein